MLPYKPLLAGVVLAFASACGLAPASADIITVNVTVTTTHDPAGLFGSLGSDISVVYTLDTSLGIFSGNDIYSEVHGGTVYGLTSPSLGATVTTAARTITYGGAYNAQLYGFNNGSRVCPV